MRTIREIQADVDQASERRRELWKVLSAGRDSAIVDEIHELDTRLDDLFEEQRAVRARIRFGDRERIVARARAEERLERHEGLARAA